MSKTTETPGSVLLSLMSDYGMNPFSLSKAIGLSQSSVRMIVLGKTKISAQSALRFAKIFGTSPDYWLELQYKAELVKAGNNKKLQAAVNKIKKAVKTTSVSKASAKPYKKITLADKRKKASKIPGSKPVSRKRKK